MSAPRDPLAPVIVAMKSMCEGDLRLLGGDMSRVAMACYPDGTETLTLDGAPWITYGPLRASLDWNRGVYTAVRTVEHHSRPARWTIGVKVSR